jgi:anti-sigma factor ChrR (cupin superfamily)
MKVRHLLAVAVSFLMGGAVLAQTPMEASPKPKGAAKSAASRLVVDPASDLKWTDLDPKGAPGVKIVDVWGNHAKGAFGAFLKFPAGFAAPLHTHTNDYKIVIVSGTMIQGPEGKPEFRIGPGSYLMQPGGNYKHTTACDQASDCVFFVQSTGKFDLKVVDAAKAVKAPEPEKK